MDQNSVDALIAQVQSKTDKLSQQVGDAGPAADAAPLVAEATAALDKAAAAMAEIAGEMEAPLTKNEAIDEADPSMMGEFASPVSESNFAASGGGDAKKLLAIEVPLIVQLGSRRMTVGEVMRLAVGAIVEFNKSADEELELLVNNKSIGKGEAVKVGENFGIKITNIGSIKETIRKLGGV